ncbi:MAG: hypothetical protein AVDCRST_MAG04-3738 [uncultured Acetobacteraceae bacterium]|uniref:Uncharacterized protein n=1 Tax=uncultured Acetobacteraceae bacterium TaxID=169975 RepID=A0A6J4JL09_9PROT|nr:MAG: hypothetical protein AVDCRST_MAG04-3738 [uncultured Acetobacteraceae bacterium]
MIGAREAASRNENRQDRVQDQSGKRMCVSRRCGDATVRSCRRPSRRSGAVLHRSPRRNGNRNPQRASRL